MTTQHEIDTVLHWVSAREQEAERDLDALRSEIRQTSNGLDDIDRRLAELGLTPSGSEAAGVTTRRRDGGPDGAASSPWTEVVARARRNLEARGVDISAVRLDDLLDPEEIERISRRFEGDFEVRARLDRYDIAAAFTAGVVASAIDVLFVLTPPGFEHLGIPGSPLTKWLHDQSVSDDNLLAKLAKVTYDRGGAARADLGAPKLHRLYSLGHEFPFGLIVGVFDVMRGGLTAIDKHGALILANDIGDPVYNPFVALTKVSLHWFSDAFTKMGLPPPGWSLTQLLQFGSVTLRGSEYDLAGVARWMYQNGYDYRHFLTASTSVAAGAITLRSYYWLRRLFDEEYEEETTHEQQAVGAQRTGEHPRYIAMSLITNTVAAAANAGKVALFAPSGYINPAAFNYPQWLAWGKSVFNYAAMKMMSPSEVLAGQSRANLICLEEGWAALPSEEALELPGLTGDGPV